MYKQFVMNLLTVLPGEWQPDVILGLHIPGFGALLAFSVLLLTGLDFDSSFSAIVASINNAGPGLGSVGPMTNYQKTHNPLLSSGRLRLIH